MKGRQFYLFFLILSFSSLLGYSQENFNFRFKSFEVTDGLSENAVYSILQDQDGFMWFGTKDGLNRFDGSSFRVYQHQFNKKGSIGNNFIRCLAQMDKNHLYIGTDAGLYLMNKRTEIFTHLKLMAPGHSVITDAINCLLVDRKGTLWIATMSYGIYSYHPANRKLRRIPTETATPDQNIAWSVIQDKSGTIWAGTRAGLLRYNLQSDRFEAISSLFSQRGNSENEVLSMLEDNKGDLWLGTWADGLRCYNKRSDEYTSYMNIRSRADYITHIRAIYQYSNKSLMIGSDDGLYLFNMETGISKRIDVPGFKYSLSDQNVYSIASDKERGLWIGTYFGGVNYLNTALLSIETYHPDFLHGFLSGKAVSQFCEDRLGNMWIATEDGGVNYLNTRTGQITQPVRTSYHNTHALLLDGEDLWIGTFSRGIDVYNTRTKKLTNYRHHSNDPNSVDNDCIFSLYKSKAGDIYIGTSSGLNKFDRRRNKFIRIREVAGFIYDINEDDAGNLWLASYGGGPIRFNYKSQKWIHYSRIRNKDNDPIVNSKLTSLYIDSQRRIIFTSEGKGIFIYDRKKDRFINISQANGLPNSVIYGALDDPLGNLWLSSNKGLICIDIAQPGRFKLYNIENGLQSNQFNYKSSYKTRDGKFYFGGINGFNSFYPQDLNKLKNQIIPHVAITQIRLLSSSDPEIQKEIQAHLNKGEPIKLSYNRASFTLSFVSLSFISPSQNQYAYKLEGADADWSYSGNNKNVTYVNLSPGKYIFKVKASNNDGLWNKEGSQISIEILPPFWWSIPARIVYILSALSLIYLAVKYDIKRNKEKQIRHLEAFKMDQETRAFKSKIEFFTTIAHEIRTPISLISAPLEEIISYGAGDEKIRQNLSVIEQNCDRLTDLINQLLDFRKMDAVEYKVHPESIEIKGYVTELYERFKKTAQNKNIEFDLKLPEENKLFVWSDADALTKVIGNLLTNALKFTNNKIIIELRRNKDQTFTISVEDNGPGIPDDLKTLIFDPFYQIPSGKNKKGTGIGLSLVKHLSSLLNGDITITDADKEGSVFSFTFTDLPRVEMSTTEAEVPSLNEVFSLKAMQAEEAVLVVDDNPDMTAFISNCLKGDYSVDVAHDAASALKILEVRNYNVIISDIMMPDMDGISFTKRIKSDVNYSHIAVILLSAKVENSTKAEGLRSGADVFIEKPFSTIHLRAQIASLLKNRKALLEAFHHSPLASYSSLATNKSDEHFLNRLNDEIEKHISDENFSVESLTDILGISRSNLQRKLKAISGYSPGDYLRNYRLKKACILLLESDSRINEVAFRVGFNSASYFTKAFYKCYNLSPREFINNHQKSLKKTS